VRVNISVCFNGGASGYRSITMFESLLGCLNKSGWCYPLPDVQFDLLFVLRSSRVVLFLGYFAVGNRFGFKFWNKKMLSWNKLICIIFSIAVAKYLSLNIWISLAEARC
jgi:hypothetical protein